MPKPLYKGISILLLVVVLTILMTFIPELASGNVDSWLTEHFGSGYKPYLLAIVPFCVVLLILLTTDVGKWFLPGIKDNSAKFPPGTPSPELVTKVRQYLKSRYEHRLSQKLAGRQPVNLRVLPSVAGISDESAESLMTLEEEDVRGAIGDIFFRANGRLMLIGLPGSGKTTVVLQLALHLLERTDGSFPVVLNLATWRSEFQTFEAWLRKILPAELGASTGLAEQIRKSLPLILLLDGLDEVPEADRDSLISVIGEYSADANRQFLISSRTAEYAAIKDAPVNAQVEVAPLTIEQVEMSLSASAHIQPESRRLLNALKSDPLLRSSVENPFYLNTAQLLFASGKNWSELGFVATDVAGRQRELVEEFVKGTLNQAGHKYPPEKARHWLSFLASRMTERNMVVFELRDLQYNWWSWSKLQLIKAKLVFGLVLGLFLGVSLGLVFGFIGWQRGEIFEGIITGLVFGLIFGLILCSVEKIFGETPEIQTMDSRNWSWGNFIRYLYQYGVKWLYGPAIGALFGLFLILFGLLIFLLIVPIALLIGWLSGKPHGDLFGDVFEGWTVTELFNELVPCIIAGLLIGLLVGLFNFLLDNTHIISISNPYQRFNASRKVLWFSILQHIHLRYELYHQNLLPIGLVGFLNELALRHILEFDGEPQTGKNGGSWRFRHRILQDYFAEQWVEPNGNQERKSIPNE